ncbi:MAG: hypothetical protein J0H67_23600 [Rhodospirillales bacterium]|nr:hypothetical protein [Rhodospirillales bacterium]
MSGSISNNAYTGGGSFSISNGQIFDPNGNVFEARGIGVFDWNMNDADKILASFPGLNFVRLAIYSYQDPSAYQAFVNTMTSHGVVVEFENHQTTTGSNAGGAQGHAFSGQMLSQELSWYSSVASAYAGNPLVWFGTNNEPPVDGLSYWQQATYDAIRNTGNSAPIMLELPGGGVPSMMNGGNGLDPSVYAGMNNVLWDVHYYGWAPNYSSDPQTVAGTLTGLVHGAQAITSANGVMPVIIGEYGPSTDGYNTDPNGDAIIQAVHQSNVTSGAVAWAWSTGSNDNLTDGWGNLSSYGQEVASWISSGGNGSAPLVVANNVEANASGAANGATAIQDVNGQSATMQIDPNTQYATVAESQISVAATGGDHMLFVSGNNNTIALSGGNSMISDSGWNNTYVVPQGGQGWIGFDSNVLYSGDVLDLRSALAATDWNGAADMLPAYLGFWGNGSSATLTISATAWGNTSAIATIAGADGTDLSTLLSHAIT